MLLRIITFGLILDISNAFLQHLHWTAWKSPHISSSHHRSFPRSSNRLMKLAGTDFTLPEFDPDTSFIEKKVAADTVGSFFLVDPVTNHTQSLILCWMSHVARINGTQYGFGSPLDTPVSLGYFEDNDFKVVQSDFPRYRQLISHVATQLEAYDLTLLTTPVSLTVQGEFEDEKMNDPNVWKKLRAKRRARGEPESAPVPWKDLIERADKEIAADKHFYDDVDLDDEEEEGSDDYDDYDEVEADEDKIEGGSDEGFGNAMGDYRLFQVPNTQNMSQFIDIPEDAIVSDQDSVELHREHKRAEKIFSNVEDGHLIASFHFAKKNFHLVHWFEPTIVIGKGIPNKKGYYFRLLEKEDDEPIRITLAVLLDQYLATKALKKSETTKKEKSTKKAPDFSSPKPQQSKPKRGWLNRK